jgi:hypothetical protein
MNVHGNQAGEKLNTLQSVRIRQGFACRYHPLAESTKQIGGIHSHNKCVTRLQVQAVREVPWVWVSGADPLSQGKSNQRD